MTSARTTLVDAALLLVRLGSAGLLFGGHGLPKISAYAERASRFADPLSLGSELSYALVVLAEVPCAILVALGLWTRLATVPVMGFLLIAAFIQHADDPWGRQELPLLFFVCFAAIALAGPGRWSLDARRGRRG